MKYQSSVGHTTSCDANLQVSIHQTLECSKIRINMSFACV